MYSNGYSAALGETLVREAFGLGAAGGGSAVDGSKSAGGSKAAAGGSAAAETESAVAGLTSGELALNDRFGKALPLSIYVRLER